jgi:hexosaminidase
VKTLSKERYAAFIERVQQIVEAHGKRMLGWQEIIEAKLSPGSAAQYWDINAETAAVTGAVRRGTKLVMSPASKAYLDMKYDKDTKLGQDWAGLVEVQTAYEWEPATVVDGVTDKDVLGVEAPIWSETLENISDVEFMAFPRLPAVAEIGWSPATARKWDGFRQRLAEHGPRWSAMSVNYYRSPQIPWPE